MRTIRIHLPKDLWNAWSELDAIINIRMIHNHNLQTSRSHHFLAHAVFYIKKDEVGGDEPSQVSIGGKIPFNLWDTDVCCILWVVRWSSKGLIPVRPQVHLKSEVLLQTGRALGLHD